MNYSDSIFEILRILKENPEKLGLLVVTLAALGLVGYALHVLKKAIEVKKK